MFEVEHKLSAPSDEGAGALATEGEKLKTSYFKINLSLVKGVPRNERSRVLGVRVKGRQE